MGKNIWWIILHRQDNPTFIEKSIDDRNAYIYVESATIVGDRDTFEGIFLGGLSLFRFSNNKFRVGSNQSLWTDEQDKHNQGPETVRVDLRLILTGPREPELRAKYST